MPEKTPSSGDVRSAMWIRSKECGEGTCVEVAFMEGAVAVRDSKDAALAPLVFSMEEWRSFVDGVKAGQFDGAAAPG